MAFIKGLSKETVLAITEEQRRPEQSEKAKKLSALLLASGWDQNYRDNMAKILAEIIGEPLFTAMPKPSMFTGIVCTANPNGHDYVLGDVIVYQHGGNRGWRKNGTLGNDLPCNRNDGSWRLATKEEIEAAFKE